jgi:hypothetical protein
MLDPEQQQEFAVEDQHTLTRSEEENEGYSPSSEIQDTSIVDWIETEIVIDDVLDQPTLLPDGQIDIELD